MLPGERCIPWGRARSLLGNPTAIGHDVSFYMTTAGRVNCTLMEGLRVIKEQVWSGKVRPQAFSNSGRNGNRGDAFGRVSVFFAVEKNRVAWRTRVRYRRLAEKVRRKFWLWSRGRRSWMRQDTNRYDSVGETRWWFPPAFGSSACNRETTMQCLKSHVPGKPVSATGDIARIEGRFHILDFRFQIKNPDLCG